MLLQVLIDVSFRGSVFYDILWRKYIVERRNELDISLPDILIAENEMIVFLKS